MFVKKLFFNRGGNLCFLITRQLHVLFACKIALALFSTPPRSSRALPLKTKKVAVVTDGFTLASLKQRRTHSLEIAQSPF